ncbi:MAG TPA: hemolysin family protein [Planctomycetota bacterium]
MSEILVILALILVNGLLSGAEIAIISIRRSRLEELVRGGRAAALAARKLREQPERFLATVQVGITTAGAAAAAFGGASLAEDLEPAFRAVPALLPWAEELAFVTVVGLVTYLSVVLGELVPKSIGLRVSERYALLAAPPLLALAQLARPVVWLLSTSSNLVLRLFGDQTTFTEARISQEELRAMMIDAGKHGTMASEVSDIATRALDFGALHASDVMIHRRFVVALSRNASPETVRETFLKHGHQRLPVFEGSIDNVVGYLAWRDVLSAVWKGTLGSIDALLRPAYFAPESMLAVELLHELRRRHTHLAIVVDEHGGVEGLITLEDLLEELVGEIRSEHAPALIAQVVREAAGTFVVPGHAPLREVIRETGLELGELEEVSTLGGLCVRLNDERVPDVGQVLRAADGTELEIVDASPRRVRSVRLRRAVPVRRD